MRNARRDCGTRGSTRRPTRRPNPTRRRHINLRRAVMQPAMQPVMEPREVLTTIGGLEYTNPRERIFLNREECLRYKHELQNFILQNLIFEDLLRVPVYNYYMTYLEQTRRRRGAVGAGVGGAVYEEDDEELEMIPLGRSFRHEINEAAYYLGLGGGFDMHYNIPFNAELLQGVDLQDSLSIIRAYRWYHIVSHNPPNLQDFIQYLGEQNRDVLENVVEIILARTENREPNINYDEYYYYERY